MSTAHDGAAAAMLSTMPATMVIHHTLLRIPRLRHTPIVSFEWRPSIEALFVAPGQGRILTNVIHTIHTHPQRRRARALHFVWRGRDARAKSPRARQNSREKTCPRPRDVLERSDHADDVARRGGQVPDA